MPRTDMSTDISHRENPFVLSIDIGTSGIRAAVYDAHGDEVAGTAMAVPHRFSVTADGGAEADAFELAADAEEVLARSFAAAGALRIDAVTVATFWHALVGIDPEGHPVTPIYGWADTRAAHQADELRTRFDERAVHHRTGCRFHPGYWPAKIMWLRATRPDLFNRVNRWVSPADHLLHRWSGILATSVSMASGTGLLDQRRIDWDEELLTAIGIDRSALPKLADVDITIRFGDGVLGNHLRSGVRLFPAIGDGAANNIGSGCMDRYQAALMIGTSGAMRVVWKGDPPDELPSGLWQYRVDRDRVIVGGALSDGGGLYRWMRDTLSLPNDLAALDRQLAAAVPDGHGLTLLPFWSGERSTGWNPPARGGMFGMTMDTKPVDLMRAAMEGVAYRFAGIGEQLNLIAEPLTISAAGGALRDSVAWVQILADVLEQPIRITPVDEATSRGAALLGLERLGLVPDLASVSPQVERSIMPKPQNSETYRRARKRQQKLRDQLFGPEA